MGENNNISTLVELFREYDVEIPKIQRDYAHGRQDLHSKQVIKNLLKDMKKSLVTGENLDINFVYGRKVNEKFIPIDGQQRLTTLFLLHVYAFKDDELKTTMLKKFTYQTRKTSGDFFEKLVENRKYALKINENEKKLYNNVSEKIRDSYWFLSSWKYDPTIISALNVLDMISREMKDIDNLKDILEEKCPITFKFLDMKKLGMEDELYIKLNARGRSLTNFENFKAKFLERMRKLDFDEIYITNFEIKLDGIWTDYFWKKVKENSETIKSFDKYYYAFFESLLFDYEIIENIENEKNWIDTLEFSKINKEIFDVISYTLDYITSDNSINEVDEIIEKNIKGGTYTDKILFYAITTYLYKSKGNDDGSLKQWIRIIKNITVNSDIDKLPIVRNALKEIDNFANNWNNLLNYFANLDITNNEIKSFDKQQINEEIIKAKIICNDNGFANEIYRAEKNEYFNGQIRSALYLAKKGDIYKKEIFVKYWNKIEKLFNDESTKYGNLMRRALLTINDYTIMNTKGYKTFCIDKPIDDVNHISTMKTLFSNCDLSVKQLLDMVDFEDIEKSLKNIINEANVKQRDWRFCFIKYPNLLSEIYMNKDSMRIITPNEYKGMIIVRNKIYNGINKTVYLAALYEELKNRGLNCIKFDEERGSDVTHFLILENYKIYYLGNEYIVKKIEKDTQQTIYETTDEINNPIDKTADFIEDLFKE